MAPFLRNVTAAVLSTALAGWCLGAESHLRLENDRYLVEVDAANGAITRLQDKAGKLELLTEPRLADNFKFSLPLRGPTAWQSTEANYILGREQRLSEHELNGRRLLLKWNGPLTSVLGKPHDVSAVMIIELTGEDVRFTFRIDNAEQLEIGEVYYPILGGLTGLGETAEARRATELVVPGPIEVRRANIFHTFSNFAWLGVLGAEQYYSYPDGLSMPWLALTQPTLGRSIYFGAHDPVARHKVVHLEMSPGVSGPRAEGNWPRPDELKGLPAGVRMCFVHMVYQTAGRDFEATPVVLRGHAGDWHESARLYGAWLASELRLDRPRDNWLDREPAIQQVGAVPFRDLSAWAQAGARAGVRALLLADWKVGGHNDGIPRFEPNPALGTPDEFVAALRACRGLGVKVAVNVNLQPVTQLSDWYRQELRNYVCMDRWGIVNMAPGAFTPSPLTGGFGTGEQRVFLNPGHPAVKKLLTAQIRRLAGMGVDGVQLSAFFARPLDHNPTVRRTPDRASWEGGLECIDSIVAAAREVRPEFAMSTDAAWDRVPALARTSSAESRSEMPLRVAFPSWRPTTLIGDEDALPTLNDWLRVGGQIRIAPANGQPMGGDSMAGVADYFQALLAMRQALRHTLIEGEHSAASLTPANADVQVAVFENVSQRRRTAILQNPSFEDLQVEVSGLSPASDQPLVLWQPSGSRRLDLPATVSIGGRQVAILTEEPVLAELARVPRWQASASDRRPVFDFATTADLKGWTFTGNAFGIGSIGALNSRRTLNSLTVAGETATGTATSPEFTLDPACQELELVLQGGWSQKVDGKENLAIFFTDAKSGAVLEQVLPPGIHELRVVRIRTDALRGKPIRMQLVDNNTAGSFAWIGVRRVSVVEPQATGKSR